MDKKKTVFKAAILLLPLLSLSGCFGGQDRGFDLGGFLRNPFVMIIIGIIVLWFAFRGSKHG